MKTAELTACSEPGCPNLVERGYCQTHRLERRRASDSKRPSAAKRGYDAKWRKTRARHLRVHPTCQHESVCGAAAEEVHHRDGLGPLGPRGHQHSNLQSLCGLHHKQVTAQLQPGGWNA